jgi:hypothetical protein
MEWTTTVKTMEPSKMSDLGNFFSLIGEEKKKKTEKNKEIIGDVSLGTLFESLSEEKKKIKEEKLKKERELEKIKKDAKIFESFLFSETPEVEKKAKEAIKVLETELLNLKSTSFKSIDRLMRGISAEYNITPTKLHHDFKDKHGIIPDEWVKQQKEEVDTTNWRDDYKPYEIESEDIIKPEPLKPTEPVAEFEVLDENIEELETLRKIRDDVDVEVDNSSNIRKSIEILGKIHPSENLDDENDSELNVLRREIDQLRKMVYESVKYTSTIGGGGAGYLGDLSDVDISNLANNKLLTYDSETSKFVFKEFSEVSEEAASTNVAGFAVTTDTPDQHDLLSFDAANQTWIYESPLEIMDLSDGTIDSTTDLGSF